jgi:predicted dehydrogenase
VKLGIHQLDLINWYLKSLPAAVTGFSSITGWNDGRDVPDTVNCIFDYPGGVRGLVCIYTGQLLQ